MNLFRRADRLKIIDSADVDLTLVDKIEILPPFCVRFYGERTAIYRTQRIVAVATKSSGSVKVNAE